jgi:hypothetical protein
MDLLCCHHRHAGALKQQASVRSHFSWPRVWHGIFMLREGRLRSSLGPSRVRGDISSTMREFFRRIRGECERRGKRRPNTREQKCTLI